MTARTRGLLIGTAHLLLVSTLGGKLLLDRARYPRAWALTAPFDPSTPFRGRYVRLGVVVEAGESLRDYQRVSLSVENGRVIARPADSGDLFTRGGTTAAHSPVTLTTPIAFFIPEHARDPSRLDPGQELWVEVTVPPRGPPRPIRLGSASAGGEIVPLDIR